jgi:shikimate dehydrogenase
MIEEREGQVVMTPSQTVISGKTRLLAILGDPVAAVKSPQTWNPRLAALGHDAVLVPIHVRADDFDTVIGPLMRLANLDGLVLTMPFKERVIPRLSSISKRARQVGAVNAARREPSGDWIGDMFDGVGLVGAVRGLGVDPAGQTVGLIGAGGAGSAIAFAMADSGARSIRMMDADGARAERLASRVAEAGCPAEAGAFGAADVEILVNATPVGMKEQDGPPIDLAGLTPATTVIDIVTRPGTLLLREAQARGCRCAGGAAMVAAQTEAIIAFFGLGPKQAG